MKNILIPDDLHYRIKVVTATVGLTIQEFTEAALVAHLRSRHEAAVLAHNAAAAGGSETNEPVPE